MGFPVSSAKPIVKKAMTRQQTPFWSSISPTMLSSSPFKNAIKPKISRKMRAATLSTASWCILLVSYAALTAIPTVATTEAGLGSNTTTTSIEIPTSSLSVETNTIKIESNGTTNPSQVRLKGGRCPKPGMDARLCRDQTDQCAFDEDCGGESLCCHTGCNRVCILPVFTACEQVRNSAERRARSLDAELAKEVQVPDCDPETGGFKEVQCDPAKETCYCVDSQGFEVAGTRTREGREMVNCSDPRPCLGPMCRMLCPYGFQLDDSGCEICECRNVCKGVKCPGETQCEVEEIPCTVDPCPPVPSCKKPRSLDSLCAFGAPLLIPETQNPFLCGKGPGQPSCPVAFDCNVKTGDDYGVCCASNKNFEKPGSCPVVATTNEGESRADDVNCQTSCRHDLDCPEMNKCCFTSGCGKSCMKPANSTICRQQRHIAELLSQKEIEGKGYIPQCDENGSFIQKQCSRNGKICWCVSPDGRNLPQSLGPSESVNCTSIEKRQRSAISARAEHCDHVICAATCSFGFKMDSEGCPTCDCIESPCDSMSCPSGSHCEMIKDPSCLLEKSPEECGLKTTCLSESLFVNPCTMGTPLTNHDKVVACSEAANTCPSTHICVMVSPNKAGLCCVNKPRIEPTKEGMCPFISPAVCNNTHGVEHKSCFSDQECEHSMRCCSAAGACNVCADVLLKEDLKKNNKMMTMCQYISESVDKVGGVFSKFRLAIPRPQCKDNGQFEEVQCDEDKCFCVDENGAEIPGTLIGKNENNLTREACIEARTNPKCLEMNCRLGCDYGYETLDGCKICECRNPCTSVTNLCSKGETCEMVDIDCWDANCPPLPFCVPESLANGNDLRTACPKGTAFVLESNETLTCNPRARMLQCPDDFYCQDIEQGHDFGVCCPLADEDMFALTGEERQGSEEDIQDQDGFFSHDMVDLEDDNSSDSMSDDNIDSASMDHHLHHDILLDPEHLFVEGSNILARSEDIKMGQCPYLIPPSSGSQESECSSDSDCDGEKKCCALSGSTHCAQPLLLTACQHQKSIIEHVARENGIPAKRFFIPSCEDNGEYMKIQSFGKFHWCVDSAGHEIQGTRVPAGKRPNCQRPSICPLNPCSLQCEFGYQLDASGCPVCQCKQSPCEDITCDKTGEECRMMQLNCISEPCPPVPLCLPKLENPCPFGEPLRYRDNQERVTCGPRASSCPSTHKCNLSPFGEFAVCCPKPKEVCFEKPDFSLCNGEDVGDTREKWFFNSSSNECQTTQYNAECGRGPGGYFLSANLFDSKSECLSVCPALTHCERTREKNMELRKRYQHFNYIPNCDPQTGDWNPTQCFDEVGMCWCVNNKGQPVKGTMTNGTPKCQTRRGRLLGASSSVEPLVCDKGVTVHRCNVSLCEGKVCLGNPSAKVKCYVNPCGGCREKWMTEDGDEVNCEEGLTNCQKEMQRVINFQAKRNSMITVDGNGFDDEIIISEGNGPVNSQFENALTEMFLSGSSRPHLKYNEEEDEEMGGYGQGQTRTQVTPIFANFGDHKIVGLTAMTTTFMSTPHEINTSPRAPPQVPTSTSSSSEEKDLNVLLGTTRKQGASSRATSIADILAEMMSTQASSSEFSHGQNAGVSTMTSPDFIDLMPSSSQLVYGDAIRDESEHMLSPEAYGAALRMSYGYHPLTRVRRDQGSSMEEASSQSRESSHEESYSVEETSQNPEILVSIIPRRRPGACPTPNHFGILNLISGACRDECNHDHECLGAENLKCCISQCGLKCTEVNMVIDMTTPEISPQQLFGLMAPGMIPSVPVGGGGGGSDGSARVVIAGSEQFPTTYLPDEDYEDDAIDSPKMVLRVPQCSAMDNEYSPAQSQGELSWCVAPDGSPVHETLTRGKVQCDRNGTVMYRQSASPICGDPRIKPMVCTDQCLQTTCTLHPEAECVMDPCENCRPIYIRPGTGEKVECEQKCSQAPADPGYCRGYIPRYTFNATAGKCEEFIYGGCHGNDNNFRTVEECKKECEEPQPVCDLPVKIGPCRASNKRWFFNTETQACESFWYSGCGGNGNNFATKEQCENRCPDMVLCPLLLEGEMKECSRTKACKNLACTDSMNPDEYVCHVDPCTCEATLKDLIGQDIKCPPKSEPKSDDDSDEDSTEQPEENENDQEHEMTTQFVEQESAQILQVLMDVSSVKSKCVALSKVSRVKCDSEGYFLPVQCPYTDERCHCVDEAGNHLLNSPIFELGTKHCSMVTQPQLEVLLSFPASSDSEETSVQVGVETQDLLRKLQANLVEDKIEVEILPSSTNLRFTLVGRNKFDVSYSLEEMVKKRAIGIRQHGKFIPADLTKSSFGVDSNTPDDNGGDAPSKTDIFDKVNSIRSSEVETNSLEDLEDNKGRSNDDEEDDASVSAESLSVDAEYNIVAVLLTVVVAISVLLAGFGMFLSLQKKKTGTYPNKKPFDSLAFTSQIYEFETTKKVPLDLPTFRASPPPPYTSNEEESQNIKNENSCGATKQ